MPDSNPYQPPRSPQQGNAKIFRLSVFSAFADGAILGATASFAMLVVVAVSSWVFVVGSAFYSDSAGGVVDWLGGGRKIAWMLVATLICILLGTIICGAAGGLIMAVAQAIRRSLGRTTKRG